MTTVSKTKPDRIYAIKRLKQSYKLRPSGKILIFITNVSKSGLTRRMKVFHENHDITYLISDLCDIPVNEKGLKITGCGMDMTFWLAQLISHELWERNTPPSKFPKTYRGNGGTCIDWTAIY